MCKAKRSFRKKGNMLSGVISRHQNCDDRRYIPRRKTHVTELVEKECCNHNRKQKHLVIKKTTVGDIISETCQEELRRIALTHMQSEQQQTNTVTEDDVQLTYSYDEVEATGTESKPKSNMWKWIAGAVAGTGLAGIIAYVIKNK